MGELNWHINDLASESCENLKEKTIWVPDIHDGPRVDITSTLVHLGFKAIHSSSKYMKSPYPEALALSSMSERFSNYIKNYLQFNRVVDENEFIENFKFYKDDSQFAKADAVFCAFPVAICEGFIALNQSLILSPAHRYSLSKCSRQSWIKLNQNYEMLNRKGKLVVAAMGKYDAEYQYHFTGLRGFRLYGYGGYYAKEVQSINYNPTSKIILVGPTTHLGEHGMQKLEELQSYSKSVKFNFEFKQLRQVYTRYTLSQLANHPAIVIFPYAIMSYSIIDYYMSNIPLFVPSISLLNSWKNINERSMVTFCKGFHAHQHPASFNESIHKYNPNDEDDDEASQYWLKYADFYEWPLVTVFESWQDLITKFEKTDLKQISKKMKEFNRIKEADLLDNWCKISRQINKAQIPKTYEKALAYFGTKSFI